MKNSLLIMNILNLKSSDSLHQNLLNIAPNGSTIWQFIIDNEEK